MNVVAPVDVPNPSARAVRFGAPFICAALALLVALGGCDDAPAAEADVRTRGEDTAAPDTDDTSEDDASEVDVALPEDVDEDTADVPDDTWPDCNTGCADVAEPPCEPGARECLEDGGFRLCNASGLWTASECAPTEACVRGACTAPPDSCELGARGCASRTNPQVCGAEGLWAGLPECPDGGRCVGAGLCVPRDCADSAFQESYVGCDYMAVALPNLAFGPTGTPDAPIAVVLANAQADRAVGVTVTNPNGDPTVLAGEVRVALPIGAIGETAATVYSETRDAAGNVVSSGFTDSAVEIPPSGMAVLLFQVPASPTQTVVQADAWRVRTEAPVVAYQFSPYCCNYSFTNDASLLLPISALGTDYVYLGAPTVADPGGASLAAVMSLVGTVDGTAVSIDLPPGQDVELGTSGRVQRVDDRLYVSLDAQESLHLRAGAAFGSYGPDLTGAVIHANNPIAVFSGHECTFIPQGMDACDHLEEQLFPVDAWGDAYVLAPAVLRNPASSSETTYWKVVAADQAADIHMSSGFSTLDLLGPAFPGETDCRELRTDDQTFRLARGQSCAFGSRTPVRLSGEVPFAVMGAISGSVSTGLLLGADAGDPSMFLVAPERQFRTYYPMIVPTTYAADWVTVVTQSGNPITVDGVPVDATGAIEVPGTAWVVLHIPMEDGSHKIRGGGPFGLLSYAYDDYVSYAYTGGLDLAKR